jgi:predicted ATPase
MDSASWSLVLAACQQIDQIFIAITTRTLKTPPVQYSQIRRLPNTMYMELKNFTLEETTQCIANILRLKRVPDRLTKETFQKGQGNPFLTIVRL